MCRHRHLTHSHAYKAVNTVCIVVELPGCEYRLEPLEFGRAAPPNLRVQGGSVSASRTAIQRRDTCTFEHVYLPLLKFDCFFFLRVPLARGVHVSAVGQNKRDFPPCSHPVPPCVLPTQSFARIENDSSSSERHSEPNSYVAPFPSRLCTIHFIVPHQSSSRIRHGIHKYKP
jgi:hypothetical protein